jgi:hypothetical protein
MVLGDGDRHGGGLVVWDVAGRLLSDGRGALATSAGRSAGGIRQPVVLGMHLRSRFDGDALFLPRLPPGRGGV